MRTQNIVEALAPNKDMQIRSDWHVARAWRTLAAMDLQRKSRIVVRRRDDERRLKVEARKYKADCPDMMLYMRKPWGAGRSRHLYNVSEFR